MSSQPDSNIKVFTGNANPALAKKICEYLHIPLGSAFVGRFNDGEVRVEINENVRGKDVYLINSISNPSSDHLMELLILADAARRASAQSITAVIPYFGYARQDRKVKPRTPITSRLVADLITVSGVTRVVSLELHAGQIQGFFRIPVDHLFSTPAFFEYFNQNGGIGEKTVVVSPDAGGVERARAIAKRLNASLAIIDKRRSSPGESKAMNVIGDVSGKDAIILDDIIDTAGTLTQAAVAVMDNGANKVSAYATHGIFSLDGLEKIEKSPLVNVVITDTINPVKAQENKKVRVISVAQLMGEAIRRIHFQDSVSGLFI